MGALCRALTAAWWRQPQTRVPDAPPRRRGPRCPSEEKGRAVRLFHAHKADEEALTDTAAGMNFREIMLNAESCSQDSCHALLNHEAFVRSRWRADQQWPGVGCGGGGHGSELVDWGPPGYTAPPTRLTDAHVHTEHTQDTCLNQPRGLCQSLGFGKGCVALPVRFLVLL